MIVTEYVQNGSLDESLPDLSVEQRWSILIQVADAMFYLHDMQIMHRKKSAFMSIRMRNITIVYGGH